MTTPDRTPDPAPADGKPPSSQAAATIASPLREGPGTAIGPYKLLQLIGEGGFGSVFMAEQEKPVARMVALKIIKLGMDTRQVIARFEAERQALAMMDHPNIARVLDAGATETGRPFFVMELVKGEPIVEYSDRHNLSIPERLELFVQACTAVQHAHTKGIIHRDIKPSNILVPMQDGRPSAKVIDFGIAKATSARLTEKTLFTEHRQLVGTPEYMSPEQAEGSLDIDTRTDVYSLGVLLYELLTGSTPFDGAQLRSAAYAEVQRIIREVEPPKPSTRLSRSSDALVAAAAKRKIEPRKLGAQIRGDLDWIVMKALEKDRMRRYETANGLAMDVQRHLAGEPVIAAPPGAAYRVRKFIRRHRVGVLAGASVAAALLVGVAAFAWQAKVAGDQRDNAVKAQKSEAEQRAVAEDQKKAAIAAADTAERAAYQAQMVTAASAVEDQRMDAAAALLAATPPRLRGWEYQHLTSRLDRSLPSPFPVDWRVSRLVRAADTGVAAVYRLDQQASGWIVCGPDFQARGSILPGTQDGILALSPDGTRAVWTPTDVSDRRPAALWDLETSKVLTTIPIRPIQDPREMPIATWSPEGDRAAIASDGEFIVLVGRTGTLVERRKADGITLFTQDSRWMLVRGSRAGSGFDARAMRLLNARTFEPQPEVFRFESPIGAYGFSFWRSRVACAIEDGTLHILDIVDGALRRRSSVAPGIGVLTRPEWSPDGRLIAVGSAVGRVGVWDADSLAPRGEFAGPQAAIVGLLFLPDSGDILACELAGYLRVWPVRSGYSGVLTSHRSFVYPVVLSRDGDLLLTGGWDGAAGHPGGLKLWDARTGTPVAEYGHPNEVIWSAALTPDGRHAVAGIWGESAALRRTDVIDLRTGRVTTTFGAGQFQALSTIVHPDGHRVLSAFLRGEAYVWDLFSGEMLWETTVQAPGADPAKQHAIAAAISPDGRLLALTDRDLGIRLVNADSYQDIRRWDAHAEPIWSLSFSPDGRWLLSASQDDTVGVWDVASGAKVARLVGHNADVICAVMSPDGTRIASGGRDKYVRLWDTTRFENVAQLGGHKDYVYSLAWSPDGRQLISGSGDSTVRIWDTRTLSEQVQAIRERSAAMPAIEATVARAREGAKDPAAAIEAVVASPDLSPRQRELARQAAARFASRGAPAYYRAPRAAAPITIDGKLDDAAWNAAPWSEPFVDIEGDARPKPRFETRTKMCWDDTNLYIAAKLEDPHVWATLKNRDDIVFHDNDFEVFLDPEGDSRWYGEVEVNALGTIFDLRLERPYLEGGPAHHEWSPPGMRAAVSIDGTLNDPSDVDRGWTVEIAIPHAAFADHAAARLPPNAGDVWRINFSRVEWLHDVVDGRYVKRQDTKEDNWVWTPQHVVNMHVPEHWGFVEFTGAGEPPQR